MPEEKVLVVDDDAAVCKVITRVVASKGLKPFSAASGEEAVRLLEEGGFALMVLDLKMDGMDGFEVIERVRGAGGDVPIIILSGNNENHSKLLALDLGADDYLTKPFDPAFLAAKIQALIRRDRKGRTPGVIAAGPLSYDSSTMRLVKNGEEIALSAKEHALFKVLIENRGRPFTREELHEKVWGSGRADDGSIMVYISRLRGKIEDDAKKPKFILTVWGSGYKFSDVV